MYRKVLWFIGIFAILIFVVITEYPPNTIILNKKGPIENALERLHSRCVQDMIANTCRVMGTDGKVLTAKPGDLVFVAGAGAVDAISYHQIYAAGDAMCDVVRDSCVKQWDGPQCITARSLYNL